MSFGGFNRRVGISEHVACWVKRAGPAHLIGVLKPVYTAARLGKDEYRQG